MNKMKQLILVIAGFVVAAIVIALLMNFTKSDIQRQVSENKEKSVASAREESRKNDEEFAFISITSAGAGGSVNGYLVNKNGNRFDFSLTSAEADNQAPETVFGKAKEKYNSDEAVAFISKADIDNLYSIVPSIDAGKKFESNNNSLSDNKYTTTLYAVKYNDGKASFVKIGATGAAAENPTDGNARTIMKFFQRKTK